jgi:pimeloyl-ACP methyl ester carboxylesterase
VLLLAGSGTTDRDGNQPPALISDLLKLIAQRLASEGYASIRFDKRSAKTYATEWPKDVAAQNDFFAWDAFVGDATAALRFLQSQPEVDAARTIVAGHSEGALIAMQIAKNLAREPHGPVGLILISAPGRTGAAILREQVSANLKRAGLTADAVRPYEDYVDLAIRQIVKDGSVPPNPPKGLAGLFPRNATRLVQVELSLDPEKILPLCPGPVLVVQGEKDIQVSVLRDFPRVVAALKGRRSGSVDTGVVPSASHNLKAVANENVDPGITGPVVPEALDAIAAFMKTQFPVR